MKLARRASFALLLFIGAVGGSSNGSGVRAQSTSESTNRQPLPPNATRCDVLIPIQIEFVPLNNPEMGKPAKLQVKIDSSLDPDLIKNSWVEYEIPPSLRRGRSGESLQLPRRSGRLFLEVEVNVPDPSPHAIRARYNVELVDGRTISRTATQWINVAPGDIPQGVVRRLVEPNGTGILVYQGVRVRQ
jgi:hypothetical protein